VNLINLDIFYGVTDRLSLNLTLPFSIGSSTIKLQGAPHANYSSASGIADVTFQAEYWLSNPATQSRVTGSVGFGFKAPTGNDQVQAMVYDPTQGRDVSTVIDEAAQLGNGGWELILRAQGTAQIDGPFFAYASGYYGLSLQEHNDVLNGVPDTYSGRLGAAYILPRMDGLVLSLGGRVNGVTVKDIVGGGDLYWRRPGYVIYAEPGVTWTLGQNMASLSVPIRVYANKLDSLLDQSLDRKIGASFAPYLLLASYARRF
jgi:hypothetical protein